MRQQFFLLWQIMLVSLCLVGMLNTYAGAAIQASDCAQASLEITQTGEPGKVTFNINSDKPFVSLQWYVSSNNIFPWGTDSGIRWEYTGTHAEIVHQLPFNGSFRIHVRLAYEDEDSYCTVSVFENVEVSGMSPCAASVGSTIYAKRSYEFSYQGSVGTTIGNNTLLWEFGDGSVSSLYRPRHTYAADGDYMVKLTRTYNGCTSETYYPLVVGCENVQARIISEKYEGPGLYSFGALVSESVKSYTWLFGDGGSWVNQSSVAYKYDYDGTYPVKYTATTTGGCTVTAYDTVTITDAHLCGQPTMEIEEYSEPGKFIFVIDSDKPILGTNIGIAGIDRQWSYSSGTRWDFNGTHLELYPYKIPYNGPARVYFSFSYEYAPGKYCYTDLRDTIEVRGYSCAATISSAQQSETNYKFTLSGSNLGKAGTGTTQWEFGDGQVSDEFQPTHTYQQAGTYFVKATRTYYGCTAEAYDTVNVCISGETPMQVVPTSSLGKYTFSVASTDRITAAYWSIDTDEENIWYDNYFDLNTTAHSVTYQFDRNGTYYVWAFIFTESGCYQEGYEVFEVNDFGTTDCENINASITASKTGVGEYNFLVETLVDLEDDYVWNFGNGTTSTLLNPTVQYFENGEYKVTFTGTTLNGCSVSAETTLTVTDIIHCGKPSLQISATDDPGKFIYTINSEMPILGTNFDISGIDRLWAYSSGTRWDYNGTHLELRYTIPYNGPFNINFFLQYEYEPGKYCSVTLKDTVEVYGYPCTATIGSTQLGQNKYKFSVNGGNLGKAEKGTTLWEFGDGNSSAEFQPLHTYQQAGTYVVKATRAYYGCTAVAQDTIVICMDGEVAIQMDSTSVGGYTFSVTSVDPITEVYWGIDSNDESILQSEYFDLNTTTHSVTHQFEVNGNYSIWVYFFTAHGCYYEGIQALQVQGINMANCEDILSRINTSKIGPGNYSFIAQPLENLQNNFIWNFGNGETSVEPNPQYQYLVNGTYRITFSGNTVGGCTVTAYDTLVITEIPADDITTGIPESETEYLSVYPNPSDGEIHFSRPVSGSIYDIWGRLVLRLNNEDVANLGSHGSGIYFLKPRPGSVLKIIVK